MSSLIALNDIIPRTQIIASAGQVTFDTNWTADVASDVVVYQRGSGDEADDQTQQLATNLYNVEFIGSQENVRVTLLTPAEADDVITIIRNTPADRTNLYTNTNFTPSMLNEDFGILTMVDQQAQLYDEESAPHYNLSCTFTDNSDKAIDMILPILGPGECWRKNNTNTAIETFVLDDGTTGAPANGPYVTYQANSTLSNEFNLGGLTSGILKQSVASGISTPAIAILGTDYYGPGMAATVPVDEGGTGADNAADARINLGLEIGVDVEAWSASLDALAALAGTGFIAQTGANTFAERSMTGTANQIDIANGNGVAANPVFSLSSTLVLPGTLELGGNLDVNDFEITNNIVDGDIALVNNGAGMISMNATQPIEGVSNDPTFADDSDYLVPTQSAVLALFNTLNGNFTIITPPAYAATTADLAGYAYSNGAGGIGATLTAPSNGAFSVDGVSPPLSSRILVKDQTASEENGLYELTTVGDGSNPAVLTRATDYDEPSEIVPGTLIPVIFGNTNARSIWLEVRTVVTIGTDPISFIEFAQPANTFVTLNTTQTIPGIKTFSSGSFKLAGSSSGSITVIPDAVAGTNTITLPATTDTVVTNAFAATLTNKTISGSSNTLSNIAVSSLANGTAGQLITWSALGAPTTVATGTAGQVLTSNGAGLPPTMQTVPGASYTAPTQQIFTSGSGTYTTPGGVLYIQVEMVGGGGGGGGSGQNNSAVTPGGTGGTTTFGTSLLTCNGGAGGVSSYTGTGGIGGTASISAPAYGIAVQGGSGNGGGSTSSGIAVWQVGGTGASSPFGGAGGAGQNSVAQPFDAVDNTGSGGGGSGAQPNVTNSDAGGGGGAGGYIKAIIPSPAASYSYSVGVGGAAGLQGFGGFDGGLGGSGIIIVTEFYQ